MVEIVEGHSGLASLTNNGPQHEDIKHVLTMAHEQLSELLKQRATIVKRITTLRRTLTGLREIFGDEVLDAQLRLLIGIPTGTRKSGLTDACRSVLISSSHALAPGEVVMRIRSRDTDLLDNQKNAVASITTILRRLQLYGEVTVTTNPSGRRAWMWKH
jgi:hypothetical protein